MMFGFKTVGARCRHLQQVCRCPLSTRSPLSLPIPARRLPCLRAAAVQTSGVSAAQQLLEHIRQDGGSVSKVVIEESLTSGTAALIASSDISAGEVIVSIPQSTWISPASFSSSPIGHDISSLEPWLQIALYILHAKHTGKNEVYVGVLPELISLPLLWSDEELERLRGTQLLENVLAYKEFFRGRFSSLQESLFCLKPDVFTPEALSFENFLWAAATVRSRLHPPLEGADAALVPLADMVSHKRGVNTKWKVATTGLINRKQVLLVEASKVYRRGEEISMDYGPDKVDNQLVLDYGVFDASQKQEGYVLSLSLPASDQFIDDKLAILEDNGFQHTAQFLLRPGMDPAPDMLAFLRLMQLQKHDVFLLESLFREEVWSHLQLPVSDFNEELVCQAMIAGATEALAMYPTAIEDDLMLLRSGTLVKGSREELAVQIRLGEKEALNAVLMWFEERMTSLKALEYYQERRLKRLGLVDEKGRSTFDGFFKGGIA